MAAAEKEESRFFESETVLAIISSSTVPKSFIMTCERTGFRGNPTFHSFGGSSVSKWLHLESKHPISNGSKYKLSWMMWSKCQSKDHPGVANMEEQWGAVDVCHPQPKTKVFDTLHPSTPFILYCLCIFIPESWRTSDVAKWSKDFGGKFIMPSQISIRSVRILVCIPLAYAVHKCARRVGIMGGGEWHILFKIIIIGDASTGKSCLLHQFLDRKCEPSAKWPRQPQDVRISIWCIVFCILATESKLRKISSIVSVNPANLDFFSWLMKAWE